MTQTTTAILVLALAFALAASGCDGTMGTGTGAGGAARGAVFEVQALAPHCLEGDCRLDRPLAAGAGVDLLATLRDGVAGDATVTAESSDPSVLAVEAIESLADTDEAGLETTSVPAYLIAVRGLAAGTATLRVLRAGSLLASTTVRVEPAAAIEIELGPGVPQDRDGAAAMIPGDVAPYLAAGVARDGGPLYLGDAITWTVADPAVALLSTDEGGVPTVASPTLDLAAVAAGNTTLTAAVGDTSASVRVLVEAP